MLLRFYLNCSHLLQPSLLFATPKAPCESMIRTWSPELLDGSESSVELNKIYRLRARRWRAIVNYFLDYRSNHDRRILFISSDKLKWPDKQILNVLGLPPTRTISNGLQIINRGPASGREPFNELFSKDEAEFLYLFTRACAQSDADFGRPSRAQLASA